MEIRLQGTMEENGLHKEKEKKRTVRYKDLAEKY